MWPGAELNEKE